MKDLINDLLEMKMADGTIRNIVSEKIDKLIKDVCDDLTGYGGEIKKKMKEYIEPVMVDAIERSNFKEYTVKLTEIINDGLKNSSLDSYNTLVKNVRNLLGEDKKYEFGQDVKLSDIFEEYIEFVETHISKDDIDEDDLYSAEYDSKYTEVECKCYIDDDIDDEHYFGSRKNTKHIVLTNSVADDKEDVARKTTIKFDVYKSYDGKMYLSLNSSNIAIEELKTLPEFIIKLITMKNNWCNIILDETRIYKTVEVTFEGEY